MKTTCSNRVPNISKECPADYNLYKDYNDAYNGLVESAIYGILKRSLKKSDYADFELHESMNGSTRNVKVLYKNIHKATIIVVYGNKINLSLEFNK